MSRVKKGLSLGGFIAVAFLPVLGAVGAKPGEWYLNLRKPPLNPPGWVFGPVWTLLYLLMGISAWMVWNKADAAARRPAMGIFGVQLFCNGLWSWLFFTRQRPDLAMVDLIAMWVAIVAMIRSFHRIEPRAGLLQVPYLLWVSFAGYLNLSLWWLNR